MPCPLIHQQKRTDKITAAPTSLSRQITADKEIEYEFKHKYTIANCNRIVLYRLFSDNQDDDEQIHFTG
jgi:hypothetical protein